MMKSSTSTAKHCYTSHHDHRLSIIALSIVLLWSFRYNLFVESFSSYVVYQNNNNNKFHTSFQQNNKRKQQKYSIKVFSHSSSKLFGSTTDISTEANAIIQQQTNHNDDDDDNDIASFVTAPVPVYIEDTDAYGVIYNANYVRAYDRALHRTSILSTTSSSSSGSVIQQHDGWSIVRIETMKFKSSPSLGDSYVICAKLTSTLAQHDEEIWDMEMTNEEGDVVYNTATGVHISHPPFMPHVLIQQPLPELHPDSSSSSSSWLPQPEPFTIKSSSSSSSAAAALSSLYHFPTFRDEFDSHLPSHLPLHSLLKIFERCRSNMLGGPNELHALKENEDILFVVTAVKDCSLVCYEEVLRENKVLIMMNPGVEVAARTDTVVKRRGMILEFYHTAYLKTTNNAAASTTTTTVQQSNEENSDEKDLSVIIGQAIISIMSISAKNRRPTSKLPKRLLDKFGIE